MEILKLKPAIKDYIWGGQKLINDFGKDPQGKDRIAECWELSLHGDGLSVVDSGMYKGQTLKEVLKLWGADALGKKAAAFEMFPQLIKLIDAKDSLSIQVHPDDNYALKNEGQYGKTEVWYIIDSEPGAGIYCGFNTTLTKDGFAKKIKDGTVCDSLKFIEVKPGDVFFIAAGTIHAICKGITIAEIQQNSNLTYRVYDYGRMGADGKPRELHIDKAVEVTNLTATGIIKNERGSAERKIAADKYFYVTEYIIYNKKTFNSDSDSFNAVMIIEGSGKITSSDKVLTYKKGQTFFVPSNFKYEIQPDNKTIFLLSRI